MNRSASRQRLTPLAVTLATLSLAAGGCVSSSDIQLLSSQINDVQHQVLQLEKQMSTREEVASLESSLKEQMEGVLHSEADMQVRLDSLSSQIEQLQAKLEDTNYRLAQLSQQIASTNQELRAFRTQPRMFDHGATEGNGEDAGAAGTGDDGQGANENASSSSAPAIQSDPQELYQRAYDDYLRGNYDLAVEEFDEYLSSFPNTDLADNATYWIGECHYRQGKYRQAIDQFDKVLRRYPRSDKVPGALLKKGYAYLELGEKSQAIVQLQYVIREHPNSDEANIARDRLKAIGVDINR